LLDDGDDASNYGETVSGMGAAQASITSTIGDYYTLVGICDDSGDEYCYYERDITNISSDTYTKFLVRWSTQSSSNALGARAQLVFTSGTQDLLESTGIPQFSTDWTTTTGTITSGKTIDKIRLYADDYPNSIAAGTHQVYYDFIMLYKDTWTIPFFKTLDIDAVNVYADLHPWRRGGDITQFGGMESVKIRLEGDMQHGESSWGGTDLTYGEYLMLIHREMSSDPFQWFTSDLGNYKVTSRHLHLSQNQASGQQRRWWWLLKGYSLSSLHDAAWNNLWWAGLP